MIRPPEGLRDLVLPLAHVKPVGVPGFHPAFHGLARMQLDVYVLSLADQLDPLPRVDLRQADQWTEQRYQHPRDAFAECPGCVFHRSLLASATGNGMAASSNSVVLPITRISQEIGAKIGGNSI